MTASLTRVLTAIILLLAPSSLPAQQRRPAPRENKSKFSFLNTDLKKGGKVTLKYRTLESVKGEYSVLEGEAEIKYQDITIKADKITYMEKTQDTLLEGNVIIDQGPQRLSAEHAQYNLAAKTGILTKARGSFEPSVYFTAERVEKVSETTYKLTDAVMTSCDLADPAWSFRVGSAVVTVDDYARLRNVSFLADRLPLFWTPYIVWPTSRSRARGLLIPRVGSNDIFGKYIENSYFIPMGQSMDLTARADFYSEGAVRSGGIFRYVPSENVRGEFEGYYVNDPASTNEWRYNYTHTQEQFPGGFRAVVDIRDFSNLEFFKRFERDFDLRTISSIYSSAYLTKNRPTYSLNIRADRREHFLPSFTTDERSVVFEQLPIFQYSVYPQRVGGSPLYFSMESSAGQLRRKERAAAITSTEYFRGDIFPTLSLQLKTPAWFSVKPQLSLRETYYTSRVDPTTREIREESLSRRYGQAQVEFVGPSFSRIYNRGFRDFGKFKHVIEPRVRYLHTTEVEKQNEVISFDTVDTPFLPLVNDLVEYSMTHRLIGKPTKEGASTREVLSITLRQSMSLSEPFRTRGTEEDLFTPLTLNVRANPYQSVNFDGNATFGNISHQLDQLSLSTNLNAKERYLNFTWFATFLQPGRTTGKASQFRVSSGAPIWKNKLRADLHLNYDAERGEFLERRYATLYTASCFGVAMEMREFNELQPDGKIRLNRDYEVTIDLKNVGPLRIF